MNVLSGTTFCDGVQMRVFVNVHDLDQNNIRAARRAFGLASSFGVDEYLAWMRAKVACA